MLHRWIPWKFIIKRAARAYGVIDPLTFLARIRQFSQPSEVQEPIELVRAGIAFHTRGLINTKAIQHNLDWIWPYWVERQFNPHDSSFVPRAFSFSHVNLTHRNWTAVGHPDLPCYPIVDPRGLVTPLYDGWSIDTWIVADNGDKLLPSRLEEVEQTWLLAPNLAVKTSCRYNNMEIHSTVHLEIDNNRPVLQIDVSASCPGGGSLIFALRPYNPEGIQFIETIAATYAHPGWLVNEDTTVQFSRKPDEMHFSHYQTGDVLHLLDRVVNAHSASCKVGMVTAAALFSLTDNTTHTVQAAVPLDQDVPRHQLTAAKSIPFTPSSDAWHDITAQTAALQIPDQHYQFLYDAAIKTMVLLSADDIVPGPYTYRRFWFRDACLMLNALLAAGLTDRAFNILNTFPERQKMSGYFQSQEGEWDSNGQVLWIMDQYQRITGHSFDQTWMDAVIKGADWIIRKRIREKKPSPHSGLLPPGFSAEHLGPNDYYYWDDFWALAGLRSAARLTGLFGFEESQHKYEKEARDMEQAIFTSIEGIAPQSGCSTIPASPYRRMDAGAIGSMVADYPLQLTPRGDERIKNTAEFLMDNCFHKGAFFQDMIHSGANIYLTLDIAQTLLRNRDSRYRQLMRNVADLASPTGQWPEAIHPLTHGGCMGDGQHGWAAAEWLMMIRNLFIREEGNTLIVGSGILPQWLASGEPLHFGPTQSIFGTLSLDIISTADAKVLNLQYAQGNATTQPSSIVIDVPGYKQIVTSDSTRQHFALQELEQ